MSVVEFEGGNGVWDGEMVGWIRKMVDGFVGRFFYTPSQPRPRLIEGATRTRIHSTEQANE